MARCGDDRVDFADWLGETELVSLAEAFGGTRLYIPKTVFPDHPLAKAIGFDKAKQLSSELEGSLIRVPLMKGIRATYYRRQGLSHAKIALSLGMTETSVERLLKKSSQTSG